MITITTAEGLKGIVLEGGEVKEHRSASGPYMVVRGGSIDLDRVLIKGMELYLHGCTIKGYQPRGGFKNCKLMIDNNCVVHSIFIRNSVTRINDSIMYDVDVQEGTLTVLKGAPVTQCSLHPLSLQASQEQTVDIHSCSSNILGVNTSLKSATASCSNFGTYNGGVHYFREGGTVIAGCWQGKLEEFKERAEMRLVPKEQYEAVYNYFKSFN